MFRKSRREKELKTKELMAHVPDLVLNISKKVRHLPMVQHLEGVLMFLDISGFTALCEEFSRRNLGVDALTKTLNDYLGHIENAVMKLDGDIIEFAGDAVLVLWDAPEFVAREAMAKAVKCSRQIQKQCHNWNTDVGVLLGVKVALSYGPVSVSFVGNEELQHFSTSGQAVEDANNAEKLCEKGSIILSPEAWKICPEKKGIFAEQLDDDHFKIMALKKTWAEKELNKGASKKSTKSSRKSKTLKREPPVRNSSLMKKSMKASIRPYIATPVLRKVDENQPLEYLCEMREVSILFISIQMDLGYEHLHSLQKTYNHIQDSVLQFQGLTNKIFEFDKGTSFLVLFGLPGFKHEDEVSHSLQCAAQIKNKVDGLMEVKQASIGVTTGKVFCGVVGHPERHEYTVIGPKVNMAARLMMNYTNKVSCDEQTKGQSKFGNPYFTALPHVTLKGLEDVGTIYEYNIAKSGTESCIPESKHPMLGYAQEYMLAIELLEAGTHKGNTRMQQQDAAAFIVLEGEPGVGKSRFLRALADAALKNSMRVVCTRPSIGNQSTPYHTICSILTEVLGLGKMTSAQEKERELQRRFRWSPMIKKLSLLNNLLGIQLPASSGNMNQADESQALSRLLSQVVINTLEGEESGTLIAIDDAHYIDSDSWVYIKDLVGDTTVLAFTVGPRPTDRWTTDALNVLTGPSSKTFQLKGIEPNCMEPLLCQMLEVVRVPRELTNMLTAHLKGNLNLSWVKQCVHNLLHHNQLEIVTKGAKPECVVSAGVRLMELEIPESLRGCMIAFIDRLPEVERVAVKISSVIGTPFTDDALCYLMGHTPSDKVRRTIGDLLSAGVFVFDCGLFTFQSDTLLETAYTLLTQNQCKKLHERYAVYLENKFLEAPKMKRKSRKSLQAKKVSRKNKKASRRAASAKGKRGSAPSEIVLQSVYPQLINHWRKAGDISKSIDYTIHAAESAVALGNTMQAISFAMKARALNPSFEQSQHLDALATQATASVFLTKQRRIPVKRTQQRWQDAARRARLQARQDPLVVPTPSAALQSQSALRRFYLARRYKIWLFILSIVLLYLLCLYHYYRTVIIE